MAESFDYIIVGAGSAGCVLAHRLSEDPETRVLLIEAGGKDDKLHIHIPAALMKGMTIPEIHWPYQSEPESRLNNRRFLQQRGKVLGGSSSINAMVYMRGNALDYDNWVQMGAAGWSYAEVLPYFRKAEAFDGGADAYRGGAGPLGVRRATYSGPLFDIFLQAGPRLAIRGAPISTAINRKASGLQISRSGTAVGRAPRGLIFNPSSTAPTSRLGRMLSSTGSRSRTAAPAASSLKAPVRAVTSPPIARSS